MPITAPDGGTQVATDPPKVVLIQENLESLGTASGIRSQAELAQVLGVSPGTLLRISQGVTDLTPSFIAQALNAFPHSTFAALFRIENAAGA